MIRRLALICVCLCLTAAPGAAKVNPFKTAVMVNGIGISHYELDQRQRLLRSLNTKGDLERQAEDALIAERLYLEEAKRLNLTVSQEDIESGIEEFSARASLTPGQFLREIAKFGVTEDSFAAFVRAGVAWRKVVGTRFTANVEQLDILDVERALAFQPAPTITSVRLSEIALSLRPSAAARSREIADQIHRTVTSGSEFAEVARSLSVANSRADGGSIGWVQLDRLPGNVRSAVQAAAAGRVTRPVNAQSAVFVFFKHAVREESGTLSPEAAEYAVLRVAPGVGESARGRALKVISRLDTCADLRSVSREFPRGYYRANTVLSDVDATPYSIELARLDEGETAILPIEGSDAVELLMLCSRRATLPGDQRAAVLNQKRSEKMEDYAAILLENLRATAIITRQ